MNALIGEYFYLLNQIKRITPDMEKKNHPHDECPRCGSTDTYWNDSQADPDNDSAHFMMFCEDCKKDYQSVFVPSYVQWHEEE
jgi:DNA-directed RNA polymerase subunit M/transcription elongation factor TFIIS